MGFEQTALWSGTPDMLPEFQPEPGRRTWAESPLTADDSAGLFLVPGTTATFAERVFSKIDADGDCWEWLGALNKGYGVVGRGGRGTGTIEVHRAVWLLLVGPIEDGLQLDHLCRNRRCCNPDHLEPVTAEENKRRGFSMAVLHSLRDTCKFGHPKDGMTGARGGARVRYCKTCARQKANARRVPKGPRAPVTHCPQEHEYTPANTYTDPQGKRQCKTCRTDRQRAAREAARTEIREVA